MTNVIIIAILIVLIGAGLRATFRHFKGEGGCCGGSSAPPVPKKKLSDVSGQKTLRIEGMHCENCKNSVERSINRIEGAAAEVSLNQKTAVVTMDRDIPDQELIKAVEAEGFRVLSVES